MSVLFWCRLLMNIDVDQLAMTQLVVVLIIQIWKLQYLAMLHITIVSKMSVLVHIFKMKNSDCVKIERRFIHGVKGRERGLAFNEI